jgi:hypothetical protein
MSTNSSNATKVFPPQGPLNPLGVEYGDMIEYGNDYTDTTVFIYASRYGNGNVVDGNICCEMRNVRRIVKKRALQSLSEPATVVISEEQVRAEYDNVREAELLETEKRAGVVEAQPANVPDGEEYVQYMGKLCAAAARAQEIAEFGFQTKEQVHGLLADGSLCLDLVGFEESRTWEWMWNKHSDEVMVAIQKVMYAEYHKLPF